MRLALPILVAAALLAACGTSPGTPDANDTTPDAATTGDTDAGGFDAGGFDAGSGGADAADPVDSGSDPVDAGDETPDAGSEMPDAGADPVDAGPPRCTTGACEGMIASCRVQFFNEPTNGADGTLTECTGEPPANAADMYAERYCVPVCEATNSAPYLQCMAAGALRCLNGEGGGDGDVQLECANLYPTPPKDQTCVNACNATRLTCDRGCVSNNANQWLACMDCQLQCGIARANCRAACPAP